MKGFMKRAEQVNAVLCGAVFAIVLGVYGWGWELTSASFGIGASVINIRVLGWLADRLMKQANPGAPVGIFVGKFALLLVICYWLVVILEVAVIPFVAGLTGAYGSLVLSAVFGLPAEGQEDSQNSGEEG